MADGDIRVSARADSGGCAFCKDTIPPAQLHACAGCGATYHLDCVEHELERCVTLGCASPGMRPRAARPAPPDEPRDGERRSCTGCRRLFAVRAAARYSPTCLPCTNRRQAVHMALFILFVIVLFGGLTGLSVLIPSKGIHDSALDHGLPPRRRR
jgi:hypothetical protein